MVARDQRFKMSEECIPLRLELLEDLALCVIANVHDVNKAAQIELLGSELGHDCGVVCMS